MTGDPLHDREYGISPLGAHLAATRQRGRIYLIGLTALVGSYAVAIWPSGWNTGVIVAGCIVCLIVILLAYRIRHADALETDRLLGELRRDV